MPVSTQHIEVCLRESRIAAEPGRQALEGLPADLVATWYPPPLREAAVLLPLIVRDRGLSVLFTRRTDELTAHAGQISFPGGSREPADASLEVTALREATEEIGLAAEGVRVLGYLQPHPVITGFAVQPVVGLLLPPFTLVPHPREVAEIFEVPLAHLLDPANSAVQIRYRGGVGLPTYEYLYKHYRIWGATAHMLKSFITIIS
jgi:8-oxo-dGTP pyrophosphatase MutT (NUDIX family)